MKVYNPNELSNILVCLQSKSLPELVSLLSSLTDEELLLVGKYCPNHEVVSLYIQDEQLVARFHNLLKLESRHPFATKLYQTWGKIELDEKLVEGLVLKLKGE